MLVKEERKRRRKEVYSVGFKSTRRRFCRISLILFILLSPLFCLSFFILFISFYFFFFFFLFKLASTEKSDWNSIVFNLLTINDPSIGRSQKLLIIATDFYSINNRKALSTYIPNDHPPIYVQSSSQ